MRLALVALLLATLLVPAAAAQDDKVERQVERFNLYNACRPMLLVIEGLHEEASRISLTTEKLQMAAESRLRAARLYTEDRDKADGAFLYVQASVNKTAFNLSVEYYKVVTDAFGQVGTGATWDVGSPGTHVGSASVILSWLSQFLDRFLAAYLRVNESACAPPRP